MAEEMSVGETWPPPQGHVISFKSGENWDTGVLAEVRWGLVWRDFLLEDGRVIPEIKVQGCPTPQTWREFSDVSQAEREACEERLATMAAAGQDPREREQLFRAELNQYLAYTYLKYKQASQRFAHVENGPVDFPERIREVKRVVTGRLEELIGRESDTKERESAAHSLGRLKDLETSLQGRNRDSRTSIK